MTVENTTPANELERQELPPELEKILSKENVDFTMSFPLKDETTESGEPIEGQVYWLRLKDEDGQMTEGKIFIPINGASEKLIIFDPGLPGDGTGWMEKKHVQGMLDENYTVMAVRHLGTKTEGENAQNYVHCQARSKRANKRSDKYIGGVATQRNVSELPSEVSTAANVLGKNFSEISLLSHSYGNLNSLHALANTDPEITEKIKRIVGLAGLNNMADDARKGYFADDIAYFEYCRGLLNISNAKDSKARTERMIHEVMYRGIPEHIMLTQVISPEDEYLDVVGMDRMTAALGKGLQIKDLTQFEDEHHDLKNLRTETLIRLLEMYHPKASHAVSYKSKEPKPDRTKKYPKKD